MGGSLRRCEPGTCLEVKEGEELPSSCSAGGRCLRSPDQAGPGPAGSPSGSRRRGGGSDHAGDGIPGRAEGGGPYRALSADAGSTVRARRAGSHAATSVAPPSSAATATSVTGSKGSTP